MGQYINNTSCTPYIVKTKYATDDTVVAVTSVTDFGAVGDGKTDDTNAFKSAILFAKNIGGGTVFVPEGKYVVREALILPQGVCLRGECAHTDEKSGIKGTVLYSYVGKQSNDFYKDTPFIYMDLDSGVRDLAIYYPEQSVEDGKAIPYSWTIKMNHGATVDNIHLVNSYKGIEIGPEATIVTTVRNVWGTPLCCGVFVNGPVDVARFQNINFKADYWLNCGLGSAPSKQKLAAWLINNATAFLYERVDWTYFWDFTFDGYKIGMHSRYSSSELSTEVGEAGGQIYNANITNCNICLYIEDITWAGGFITNSTLTASGGINPLAVKMGEGFDHYYSFNCCELNSTGKNVISNVGSGSITLTNCNVAGSDAETLVDIAGTGGYASICSTYLGGEAHVTLNNSVKMANLVNNMTESTFKLIDKTDGRNTKLVYDNTEPTVKTNNTIEYDKIYTIKPLKDNIVDVSLTPYSINPTPNGEGNDIAFVLQKAIDDVKSMGGGIVYVPSGEYRLDNRITIHNGVELRGSADTMIHFGSKGSNIGTTFYTNYGEGNADAEPLITLMENSGVSGFRVYHDSQKYNQVQPYPYVVGGNGSGCYVTNIMLVNPYQGIDFCTNKCDNHFISGIYGTPLKVGIIVGGGSQNGIVRDCHFNPNSWLGNQYSDPLTSYSDKLIALWQGTLLKQCEAFVIEETTDEVFYTNFVYGCWKGFTLRNNADVYLMGNAVDGAGIGYQVEDTPANKEVWIVASQLCVAGGVNNEAYIKVTDAFNGKVNIVQTSGFATPATGVLAAGNGTLNLINLYFSDVSSDATSQMLITTKYVSVIGSYMPYKIPQNDIWVQETASQFIAYGNMFDIDKKNNIKLDLGVQAFGGDVS